MVRINYCLMATGFLIMRLVRLWERERDWKRERDCVRERDMQCTKTRWLTLRQWYRFLWEPWPCFWELCDKDSLVWGWFSLSWRLKVQRIRQYDTWRNVWSYSGVFSPPYPHLSWVQIFTLRSWYEISLLFYYFYFSKNHIRVIYIYIYIYLFI